MSGDGKAKFKRFNLVRRIMRETFVNGYRKFEDYMYIEPEEERKSKELHETERGKKLNKKTGNSARAYRENLKIARRCMENHMISVCPPKDASSIAYKKLRVIDNNPFYALLKTSVMLKTQQHFYFALMDMLREGNALSATDILDKYQSEPYLGTIDRIETQLQNYTTQGLLTRTKVKTAYQYALAPLRPFGGSYKFDQNAQHGYGIFEAHPTFLRAVSFFSEVSPLGIVGNQILDLCDAEQNLFSFKNSFIAQALDMIALSDILDAICKRSVLEVRAEHTGRDVWAVTNVLPICVLSSVWGGRQYIFVYDVENNKYKSQRLDFIHSVKQIKFKPDLDVNAIIDEGQKILKTMWGANYLEHNRPAHIEISFAFDTEKEMHVNQRIERECRAPLTVRPYNGDGKRVVEGDIGNCLDLVPWILSFTGYIDDLKVEGTSSQTVMVKRVCEHIQNLHLRYNYSNAFEYKSLEEYTPITKEELKVWEKGETSSPVFSDINSYVSVTLRRIVSRFEQPKTKAETLAIIAEENKRSGLTDPSLAMSLRDLCTGDLPMLVKETENGVERYYSHFAKMPVRPFTTYELCWLYTILQDRKINLFLSNDEVEHLKETLKESGCTPLYTADCFRFYDVYNDGDDYSDEAYRSRFKTICGAIEDGHQPLEIEYTPKNGSQAGKKAAICVIPVRLEYSRQDDKFMLIAFVFDKKSEAEKQNQGIENLQTFRLSRISRANILKVKVKHEIPDYSLLVDAPDKPLELIVYPFKNVLERFFIMFSAYLKSVEFDEESGACHVKMYFLLRDQKEVYAKLRSFGQGVEIISPETVREKYFIQRINRQYENFAKRGLL